MYGKGLGVANTAGGVSLLPNTGDNRVLFAIALGLVVSGIAIFVISTVLARKNRQNA
jgi:LPXTG-motif cell wall-anchored protein